MACMFKFLEGARNSTLVAKVFSIFNQKNLYAVKVKPITRKTEKYVK